MWRKLPGFLCKFQEIYDFFLASAIIPVQINSLLDLTGILRDKVPLPGENTSKRFIGQKTSKSFSKHTHNHTRPHAGPKLIN